MEKSTDLSVLLDVAKSLAHNAHKFQRDKVGIPYIEHVRRVANKVSFWKEAEIVAWLHDVIEDHPEYDEIVRDNMPEHIYNSVCLLDKNKSPTIDDYYENIKNDRAAFIVKLSDIADNSSEYRLFCLDHKTADRLRKKYEKAIEKLTT